MSNLHIEILKNLVSFKSISPSDGGAMKYCQEILTSLGFDCIKLNFENVSNLYAKIGNFKKNLCFAGHVDVVPPLMGWDFAPFDLTPSNGKLYGRGTNDMKGPLASCFAAISDFLKSRKQDFSISVILTSDEEIMGDNGTKKVAEFLKEKQETITGCILCESCSPNKSGEYIKIGCRGSLNVNLTSIGKQCHVVSSNKFGNHIHDFIKLLSSLADCKLDYGNENFTPTNLEITSIDIENKVRNIIPPKASAKINVRFNDLWTFDKLEDFIKSQICNKVLCSFERFGFPFIGSDADFIEFLKNSIEKELGKAPEIGTSGGNSDAISIREITNVVEIGSPIENAHITNEYIDELDLIKLRKIYLNILKSFSSY
ncbi:MAG: succinyl-diaminopimelate desuccinylase [Holosporales bacterium]|jgi:succinyl-diaminopimelate desuccinylase|nr:succinyl-diaminopimelate desuccinylase [Holosporales bacterium]